MSLSEGTNLGPYTVVAPLGAGGMGEVYRATDSRLKREFSPDGRWMAYASNESGGREVYVVPYPGPGEKIRVSTDSTNGGTEPVWAPDSRELLYRGLGSDGGVFAAAIKSFSPFRIDPPRRLVDMNTSDYDSTTPVRSWNVTPDGQRFLASRFERMERPITTLDIVLNWGEELRRVPAK